MKLLLIAVAATAYAASPVGIDVNALDKTCKPCDDFYRYATGTWNDQNPIPPSLSRWSKRFKAADESKFVLKDILQTAAANPRVKPNSNEQKIGDFYTSCMDTKSIDALGNKPLLPLLARIDAIQNAGDLQKLLADRAVSGESQPFAVFPEQDSRNPNNVIIGVYSLGLGLPDRDYYTKTDDKSQETRERYLKHIANILVLAGLDRGQADAAAKTVLRVETKFAERQLTRVERRDPYATDHKMSLDELQALTPSFAWKPYLAKLGLSAAIPFNVNEPKFLAEVDRQIRETSLDDWKIYLKWHAAESDANELSTPFVEEQFSFHGAFLNGAKEQQPRWKLCAESADRLLGEALGKVYVEKAFPPEAKARMQELVKNLLAALRDDIPTLSWMGPETKQKALAKLGTFNPMVGYPDVWIDYSGLSIQKDSYWHNVQDSGHFLVHRRLQEIGKPVNRKQWGMTPPTSNAYYNPSKNEIVFPAGILQPPMFNLAADDAVNYGAIGAVIGHEISHGFDDQGSQYDAQGRLKNWWTPEDRKSFTEHAQCVSNQFDTYFIEPGVHHNGKLVLGESIGDLGGVKIAYAAYHKSLEGKPAPPVIDGFTADQRFFLAFAQSRGDQIRMEQQRLMVNTDPHPVSKYRVIGPLSNMPEFQRAFGCKEGDAMVPPPEKRCQIW